METAKRFLTGPKDLPDMICFTEFERAGITGLVTATSHGFFDDDLGLEPVYDTPFTLEDETMPQAQGASSAWLRKARDHDLDLWAHDASSSRNRPTGPLPIRDVMIALMLCRVMADAPVDRITRSGALAVLRVPDTLASNFRRVFGAAVWPGLRKSKALKYRRSVVCPTLLEHRASPSTRRDENARRDFPSNLRAELETEDPVMIVSTDPENLPDNIRPLVQWSEQLPSGVDRDLVLKCLVVTHSATGWLDTGELKRRLPSDDDLLTIPIDDVVLAFRAPTSLAVARLLSGIVDARKNVPDISLDMVKGQPDAQALLCPVAQDLRQIAAGEPVPDMPRGALLNGPPGVGKTMFAKALAGSAGVPIFVTGYGEWQATGPLSDTLKAMAETFKLARTEKAAVLFIDELDSIPARGQGADRNNSYMTAVNNALLELIGGLEDAPHVFLVGATNDPGNLDPALVRTGRFDLHVNFQTPSRDAHEAILRDALRGDLAGADISDLADRLTGQPGSDGPAIVRSARMAARAGHEPVGLDHLMSAANRIVPEITEDGLYRVAVHESGHLIVGHLLGVARPARVQIGRAGQVVYAGHGAGHRTEREIECQIAVDLAGRTAEERVFGTVSTGAGGAAGCDLALANRRSLEAEVSFGFGEAGLRWFDLNDRMTVQRLIFDPAIAARVTERLDRAAARARDLLAHRSGQIRTIASTLVERREIEGDALMKVIRESEPFPSTDNIVPFRAIR